MRIRFSCHLLFVNRILYSLYKERLTNRLYYCLTNMKLLLNHDKKRHGKGKAGCFHFAAYTLLGVSHYYMSELMENNVHALRSIPLVVVGNHAPLLAGDRIGEHGTHTFVPKA